ncbi:hypothetical protein [Deinococcus radiophilus]|uniref:hypothetical protein n=1 Tax=Deinococcus radiophilus TaxID=32062 RepID=UPI0036162602
MSICRRSFRPAAVLDLHTDARHAAQLLLDALQLGGHGTAVQLDLEDCALLQLGGQAARFGFQRGVVQLDGHPQGHTLGQLLTLLEFGPQLRGADLGDDAYSKVTEFDSGHGSPPGVQKSPAGGGERVKI